MRDIYRRALAVYLCALGVCLLVSVFYTVSKNNANAIEKLKKENSSTTTTGSVEMLIHHGEGIYFLMIDY
jgi:hypothetical protein